MDTFQFSDNGRRVWNLSRSVGWGYSYEAMDARLVQYLLNLAHTFYQQRSGTTLFRSPLTIDGKVGARTDEALRAFAKKRSITRTPGVASRLPSNDINVVRKYLFWQLLCMGCDIRDPGGNAGSYTATQFCVDLFEKPMPMPYPAIPADLRAYLKRRWG